MPHTPGWKIEVPEDELIRWPGCGMEAWKGTGIGNLVKRVPPIIIWRPNEDGTYHSVAHVEHGDYETAALICAAPCLLAALEMAVKMLKVVADSEAGHLAMVDGSLEYFHDFAAPIIARAKGESK